MERLFAEPVVSRSWPLWARYGCTTVVVGAACLINLWLSSGPGGYPFPLFLLAVIITAMVFDRGSGFLAIALTSGASAYFFLEPAGSLRIDNEREFLAWMVFIGAALVTATVIEIMHLAVHKLHLANSQLIRSEREKNLLLHESAHRTRNDLTVLASLVQMQQRSVGDPAARAALASTADRIHVLARVQQRLTQAKNNAIVDSHDFVIDLCKDLKESLWGLRPIALKVHAERHHVSQNRAVAIGLIINELLTNVLKYAFPDDRPGAVQILFAREGEDYCLMVKDNGVGLAAGSEQQGTGLGQRLVGSMVAQLGGAWEIGPQHGAPGTVASVRFPVEHPEE